MRALFVQSPGKLTLREVSRPSPGVGEVLVKMKCCGVCGTDLEKAVGEAITSSILGHEVVGEVVETGSGIRDIRPGDRVFTHHHVPCYSCDLCARGEYTLCTEFGKSNIVPCGFSEFYLVPKWNVERGAVLKLPRGLNYEDGSFIEPLGCCMRGLDKVRAQNFASALIYGAGPVGLLHLKLLRQRGVDRVGVADVSQFRLSFASRLGAEPAFNPMDRGARGEALASYPHGAPELAIVATGNPSALSDALTAVARGGVVLLFGAPPKGSALNLDLGPFFIRGTNLVASYSASEKETALAVKMLSESSVSVSDLITHRFRLEEATEAFAVARQQQCVKALVLN